MSMYSESFVDDLYIYYFLMLVHNSWALYLHSVLEEAIPNLRAFMEDRYDRNLGLDYAVTEVTQRWGHLISKLVYAIAKKSHPVAFVFEDLHWADKDSLGE